MGIAFQRIVILMFENSTRANVLANSYMNGLRQKGVFLSNSFGVTHSSQPNYILSIGGDTFGIYDDAPGYVRWIYQNLPQAPPVTSVVDLLLAQGLTWRSYAEDLTPADKPLTPAHPPQSPPPAKGTFPFARKHVPFLSYPSITSVPERLANIVEGAQFEADLAAGQLPNYSWYTPNLIHDGHSLTGDEKKFDPGDGDRHVNIDNIAAFLHGFLGPDPIAKFPPETLIVITFDEAYPYHDPYAIYTLLIGDMLPAGTVHTEPVNHYSLLRSIEDNFGLGSLRRNDAVARPYWFLR
jgi:phosphoesterase family protein